MLLQQTVPANRTYRGAPAAMQGIASLQNCRSPPTGRENHDLDCARGGPIWPWGSHSLTEDITRRGHLPL